jgi:Phospholipase B.
MPVKEDAFNIFKFEGSPYEIGLEHGEKLGDEILRALNRFKFALEDDYGKKWEWFREFSIKNFYDKFHEDIVEEILGIIHGARKKGFDIHIEDIITLNTIAEIDSYFSWIKSIPSDSRCTSFIANGKYTSNGDYILAHTTWWRYYTANSFKFLFIYNPDRGYPFAMQSAPGLLFSFTDFYYNSKGIAISETTIDGIKSFNMDGEPLFQRLRNAIQYSSDMEGVIYNLTHNNNGAYANDYLIGSRDGIGLLELGTFNYGIIKKREGFIVSSNRFQFENLKEEVKIEYDSYDDSDTSRYIRMEQFIKNNKLDIETAKRLLADHYDISLKKEFPGKNSICGHREEEPRLDKFDKRPPYFVTGSIDGKIVTSKMATIGSSWIKWGKPCNTKFLANEHIQKHQEYKWLEGHLEDVIPSNWQEIQHGWRI